MHHILDYQISLNLEELSRSRPISKRKIVSFLNRFQFESILQYVQIPRLSLAPGEPSPSNTTETRKSRKAGLDGIGREDCHSILSYLAQTKGVRKIIELIVDDDQDPPHKDDIIVSLGSFDIEIFNWKKLDLCTETIYKAAPNANKIVLYSSGNNAVLRSWSSIDGLAGFPNLKEVEVYVRQRVESAATTKENIAQFKKRMAENCPQVTPDNLYVKMIRITEAAAVATTATSGNAPPGGEVVSLHINTWMHTMESFGVFVRNIPESSLDPDRRPIKVAVIDDGIDALYNDEQFANTLVGGESFCTGPYRKPYFFSSTGHGTLMADLVQRVCPKVKLYVARLDEIQGENKMQPTAESAARLLQAIRWAIDQEVDIISMSLTVPARYETVIRPAIVEADQKKILLFGAASDQGYNVSGKVYPAQFREVFCIGAAKATGRVDSAAEAQADYVFPGGEFSDIKTTAMQGTPEHAWGSSFATALASGLTALILDCAEIVGYGKQYRNVLRMKENMDLVFRGMISEGFTVANSGQAKNQSYIPVTQFFTTDISTGMWDTEGKQRFKKLVKNILRPVIERKI
ncbi:peptidase S8/S53 domain-containing protein [Kalaharituber pfeilii]|nr:peptidase S8/S53 domain-containing protein [Kalaharituber pfeilii]